MTDATSPNAPAPTGRTYPPKRYTRNLHLIITEDLHRAIVEDAKREDVHKSVIARRYLEAGRSVTDAAERAVGG